LVLGLTFRWEIQDIPAMIQNTSDATGDICSHSRSVIIGAVSQMELEKFLNTFNATVQEAVLRSEETKQFFSTRGIAILGAEVRSVNCKDPQTQSILQEIIRQNTNRISALQKQESENEVMLKKFAGEIESEKMKGKLLEIRQQHMEQQGSMEGKTEGIRVKSFLDSLGDLPMEQRLDVFNTLAKKETLAELAKGTSQLYFTPSDVDLTIGEKSPRKKK